MQEIFTKNAKKPTVNPPDMKLLLNFGGFYIDFMWSNKRRMQIFMQTMDLAYPLTKNKHEKTSEILIVCLKTQTTLGLLCTKYLL